MGPIMLLICDVSSQGFAYLHSLDDIELSPPSRLCHALTRGIQRSSPLPQHSDLGRSLQFWTTEARTGLSSRRGYSFESPCCSGELIMSRHLTFSEAKPFTICIS